MSGRDTETERRLTAVEIKVLEHCSDIKQIREDIHRVEDNLKFEIQSNREQIMDILRNEIPHIVEDIHTPAGPSKWDLLKLVGAIGGILSGIVIIITNTGVIAKAIYNFLCFFFG